MTITQVTTAIEALERAAVALVYGSVEDVAVELDAAMTELRGGTDATAPEQTRTTSAPVQRPIGFHVH